jgi:hypothetical protein
MWPQARCQLATGVLSCRHIGGDHAILLLPPLQAAPPIGAADGGGLAPALVAASSLARSSAPLALSLLADFAPLALAASCCLAGLSAPAALGGGWGCGRRLAGGGCSASLPALRRCVPAWRAGGGRRRAHPCGRCRLNLNGLACLPSGQACLALWGGAAPTPEGGAACTSMAYPVSPPARSASPITVSSSPPGLSDPSHPSCVSMASVSAENRERSVLLFFQKDPHTFHPFSIVHYFLPRCRFTIAEFYSIWSYHSSSNR